MPKTIDLKQYFPTYGIKNIKVRCRAEGYKDSEFATTVVNNLPMLSYKKRVLYYTNVLLGVSTINLYIDGVLADSIEHDPTSTEDVTIDLESYTMDETINIHEFYINVTGEDLDFTSLVAYSAGIYGVSGLYQSDYNLTRTDDAEDMSFVIDNSTGQISSDFNDVFPWKDIKVETIDGNEMVTFPEMWFRVNCDDSMRLTDIAVSEVKMATGNWYKVESFSVGRYKTTVANSVAQSITGQSLNSYSMDDYRTYSQAIGTGWNMVDAYHRTVMQFLWLIEFATKKSDTIMTGRINGSGTSGGNSRRPTGGTNEVATPSGFETKYGQMRWHYVEDFIGNTCDYLEGWYNGYVTANPDNFGSSTTGKTKLGYTVSTTQSNYCVKALGWDSNNPFLCFPIEVISNSSFNTYFCDGYYYTSSSSPVFFCGAPYLNSTAYYGLFSFSYYSASSAYTYYGARLMKTPE